MTKQQAKRYNSKVTQICDLIVKQRNSKSYGPQYWNRAYKIADLMDALVDQHETNHALRGSLKALSWEVVKTIDYQPQI